MDWSHSQDDRDGQNWVTTSPHEKHNPIFEEYYRVRSANYFDHLLRAQAQRIIADDEWPAFYDSLRSELPLTFRVTGSRASVLPAIQPVGSSRVDS